jgi:hypothetical protein
MALCLPKDLRDKFAKALKREDISIAKLYSMDDAERNIIFKQYVGKDFASFVNAKFEQAMLSNQKKALAKWITSTISPKDPIRRDMLKKVDRIKKFLEPVEEKGFLKDLADLKLGLKVTEEEAQTILKLSNQIDEFKVKIPVDSPRASKDRLAYGYALDDFKTFIGELKRGAESLTFKERLLPSNYFTNVADAAGVSKSLVATLDNSFIGRQGIKTLYAGKYSIWANTLLSSLKDFGKELMTKAPKGFFRSRSDAVMRSIRADIYSRPNALNGKYTAAKNGYGLGVMGEEAFPSSLPERVPLIGRIFKASETAFNGSALRMRADLADAYIAAAEKNGVDMLDERQATSFGKLVAGMTGRGDIGRVEVFGKETNALFFSIKFLRSNFDTLTAHAFDPTLTKEARKVAAIDTLRIGASIATLLTIASILNPGSVEWDPRGSNFGKIKVAGHSYDVTGGMRGIVILGARLVPTMHNGELGQWTKSASGKYTNLWDTGFGKLTALDYLENFFEGKAAPGAAAIRDLLTQQTFEGQKPTLSSTALNLITPISAEMLFDEIRKGNDDALFAMLAEVFGIGVSDVSFRGYGKKWEELKEKKGARVQSDALKRVTDRVNARNEKLQESARFKKMDNKEQSKAIDAIKREETNKELKRYGI